MIDVLESGMFTSLYCEESIKRHFKRNMVKSDLAICGLL
jgi:hypothetical protein